MDQRLNEDSASMGKIGQLITSVAQIGDKTSLPAERRIELLKLLMEITGAVAGTWAWGVSDDSASSIAPIATLEVGFSAEQKTAVMTMALDPSMLEEFRVPIMQRMDGNAMCTCSRTELYDDDRWKKTTMYANLMLGNFNEWIHSVRYSSSQTWSSVFLVRHPGVGPFQTTETDLVDLAMANVPWLRATLEDSFPVESCKDLTSRQRVVLAMQLDGLSRKEIAARLQITVDTVGDHLKRLYQHFEVGSHGELAAMFLRNV
ncbi:helix-turn-helix transcriptional regulator [Mariniblastus sp.]|nr:helix-turn-helix transcriptional regulator [Mariniblastus sp.]